MSKQTVEPVNEEIKFGDDEIIVSKTDLKGEIKYANDVFCRLAEMSEREAIGAPHSIIRHPDMPRTIFYYLWQAIKDKREIFAYVKNMSKTGKYYWVFAHVTPTIDDNDEITGFHSSRRSVERTKLPIITDLYRKLKSIEDEHSNAKEGMRAGIKFFENFLEEQGKTYSEFIWSLGE